MKNNYTFLSLLIALFSFSGLQAQISFSEDFNGGNALGNWTLVDVDGRTPAANVAFATDAWVVFEDFDTTGVGDSVALSNSWYNPAGAANDYMISPMIVTGASPFLEWDAKAQDANFPDGYEVRISTTTPTVAGVMANPAVFSTAAENASWTRRSVNLSAYANDTIYIAWRNNSSDMFLLLVDNIKVYDPAADDVELVSINLPNTAVNGTNNTIGGTLRNRGSANINSVVLNWSVNNGAVNRDTMMMNLSPGATIGFAHGIDWTASNPGSLSNLRVWTSMPNGNMDANTNNDSLSQAILVDLGNSGVQRNPLMEEFTTSVCQFCPDGHLIQDRIVNNLPSVIPVGVHACFNTDNMTVPEATDLCSTLGINSAPTAMVDRKLYPGNSDVAFGRANMAWDNACSTQVQAGAKVDVNLSGSYNSSSRQMNVAVDVSFADYVYPGDLRVSLMLLEDSMSGTGNGWAQYNGYYAINGHPFFGVGTPFPAPNNNISFINNYQHRHVLRDILPSTWGDATVIPSNYQLNTNYSRSFNQTLAASYDDDQVYVVAVVSYFGANDIAQYEVLNARQVKLKNLSTAIAEEGEIVNDFKIYPNPTNLPYTNVSFRMIETAPVQARIMDITGKVVSQEDFGNMVNGNQLIKLNTSQLENGFYFVNLKAGNQEITRKISVLK